ncbi:MAG: hypothetical protein IT285_05545 [Bdellovibrionales bacterium]|nr:hypothetical protein [Bdellovibrionales bacterium]
MMGLPTNLLLSSAGAGLATVVLLAACGPADSLKRSPLLEDWASGCVAYRPLLAIDPGNLEEEAGSDSPVATPVLHVRHLLAFDGTDFKQSRVLYAGEDCTQPLELLERSGSVRVGGPVQDTEGAIQLELITEREYLTIHAPERAEEYEVSHPGGCEGGGWAVETRVEITGCGLTTGERARTHTLYQVRSMDLDGDGGSTRVLSLGRLTRSHDGASASRRPIELDGSLPLVLAREESVGSHAQPEASGEPGDGF